MGRTLCEIIRSLLLKITDRRRNRVQWVFEIVNNRTQHRSENSKAFASEYVLNKAGIGRSKPRDCNLREVDRQNSRSFLHQKIKCRAINLADNRILKSDGTC